MHFTRRMLCTPVSSSKHKDLCEKCDHSLDFGENCGLYRFCWLYPYVLTLFPLHFARRMLYTPFSASRQTQLCAKCDYLLDFEENQALFRFVGDISPFNRYFHRILHAEWYARQFHRRNIKICAKNATIYSILTKTVGYIDTVGYISTF